MLSVCIVLRNISSHVATHFEKINPLKKKDCSLNHERHFKCKSAIVFHESNHIFLNTKD